MTAGNALDYGTDSGEPGIQQFARIAQQLFAETTMDDTLATVMRLARETFPSDAVSIMLVDDDGRLAQVAATHREAARADELQLDFREGPSITAVVEQEHLAVADLRLNSRWRFWAPQAADLGYRSALSLSLADDETSGVLTLYSRHPSFFHAGDVTVGEVFAQHASTALAIAREREHLMRAVESRGVVGQAQGILMERYDVDADQAFTVLRRYSSHLNEKVRSVASEVVRSRNLPELDATTDGSTTVATRQSLRVVTSEGLTL